METHEKNFEVDTHIKILGNFSQAVRDENSLLPYINFNANMKSNHSLYKENRINPIQLAATSNTLAVVDTNENVWLIGEAFPKQINLSSVTRRRAKKCYLNEKQAILLTKKGYILVNWGCKKLFKPSQIQQLFTNEKSIQNSCFQSFSIKSVKKDDFFYFSSMKKAQNSNKLYHIQNGIQNCKILGYPSQEIINLPVKILGMSVGKFHCLCWDNHGLLYSWGNKSIALGYEDLPHQSIVCEPRPIRFFSKDIIVSAFAGTHYSLGLTQNGIVYEWGIKRQFNDINQELIFIPQILKIQKQNYKQDPANQKLTDKVVSLKGKNNNFAILTITGKFYVWGSTAGKYFCDNIRQTLIPERLIEPLLVSQLQSDKILDFVVEQQFIAIITCEKETKIMIEAERNYWENRIKLVKSQWLKKKTQKIKTEGQQFISKNSTEFRRNFCTTTRASQFATGTPLEINDLSSKNDDNKISKLINQHKSKQEFFNLAKNQMELFKFIMNNDADRHRNIKKKHQKKQSERKSGFKCINNSQFCMKEHNSKMLQRISQSEDKLKFLPIALNNIKERMKQDNKGKSQRLSRSPTDTNYCLSPKIKKSNNKSYTIRLNEVLKRKKTMEDETFETTVKKIQQNSLQYRLKRKQEYRCKIKYEAYRTILKKTVRQLLLKNLIIKSLLQPLAQARALKIENFARMLKLQRKQRLIRKLFIKKRIKYNMKSLKLTTFLILKKVFNQYIAYRRQQKYQRARKLIVTQIYKSIIKEKIRTGIARIHLHIRKLQKLGQWLKLVRSERLACLKQKWKWYLCGFLKLSQQSLGSGLHLSHIRPQQQSFKALYEQRMITNPNLKLINFLNSNSIFSCRFEDFQEIIQLFLEKSRKIHKTQHLVAIAKKKTKQIKFIEYEQQNFEEQQMSPENCIENQKNKLMELLSQQILPYSQHSHIFVKPAAYEIANIPQALKKSQKWIGLQKKVLQNCLKSLIIDQQAIFMKKKTDYDRELAHFIKVRYEKLSEKRWISIIQYNKLKMTYNKKHKQKELRRLLKLVGASYLIQQDCLPQKYLVLQEALKCPDAPKIPRSYLIFNWQDFKKIFNQYFCELKQKARILKKLSQ